MAKKKKEEEAVKLDGWKDTFSDLMNLLLCFFVMLFSMSTIDAQKFQEVIASFSNSFDVLDGGKTGLEEGMLIASGASQLTQLSEYYSSQGLSQDGEKQEELDGAMDLLEQEQIKESEQMEEDIQNMIENAGKSDMIEVQASQHYVELNMSGDITFARGSADLTDNARNVLAAVADILKVYAENTIMIEGHTDNDPINMGIFTSNDVLSDYRALAVFDYLVEQGVSPDNVIHAGRGEYVPIAPNDTAENKALNRRVTIRIYNSFSTYN